jgi:hypothetical protein
MLCVWCGAADVWDPLSFSKVALFVLCVGSLRCGALRTCMHTVQHVGHVGAAFFPPIRVSSLLGVPLASAGFVLASCSLHVVFMYVRLRHVVRAVRVVVVSGGLLWVMRW